MEFENEEYVWFEYLRKLLEIINKDPSSWVLVTPERCIFETIITNSGKFFFSIHVTCITQNLILIGGAFGQNLDLIGNILAASLHIDSDAESRLKIFTSLTTALENKEIYFKNAKNLTSFLQQLVSGNIY